MPPMPRTIDTFLDDFPDLDPQQQIDRLVHHLRNDFDELCRLLRQKKPFFVTPVGTFVSRFQDVQRVLRSTDATAAKRINCEGNLEFSVSGPGQRMADSLGEFFLGFDVNRRDYCEQLNAVRSVLPATDLVGIAKSARDHAEAAAGTLKVNQFNVVTQYANPVPTAVMAEYFGLLPAPQVNGKDLTEERALRLFQTASYYVFNPLAPPQFKALAVQAANEINDFARARVAEVKAQLAAGQNPPDSVLTRLLKFQPPPGTALVVDDDWVRRMLVGLFSASVVAVVGVFANVIEGLTEVGRTPLDNLDPANKDEVDALIREAMRRGPYPALLQRNAITATKIPVDSPGSPDHDFIDADHEFKPNERIIVMIASALRDETVFGADAFNVDRNVDQVRLAFGLQHYHQCLGYLHAETILREMIKALVGRAKKEGCVIRRFDDRPLRLERDDAGIKIPLKLLLKMEQADN